MIPKTSAGRQAGLTLIELMIAVTVALVLLAALAVMYGSSLKARNEIVRINQQIENGRYAIQLLRDDIQLAGYWGELNFRRYFPPTPTDAPDICVTHNTASAGLPADSITPATDYTGDGAINGLDYLAGAMAVPVQGFNDVTEAGLPSCLQGRDVRENTDVVVVRRAMTCAAGDANCAFTASVPYLQVSQCNTEKSTILTTAPVRPMPILLRADAATTAFTLMDRRCLAANRTPVRRYLTHVYFIANNNVSGDGIPTLKRLELISSGYTTTPLVEGIEGLEFEYGLDQAVDSDGNPDPLDGLPDAPFVDLPAAAGDWANTMAVRVHVLSRSVSKRSDYSDDNTYKLTEAKSYTPSADEKPYTRQVFETLIQLNNVVGRRQ